MKAQILQIKKERNRNALIPFEQQKWFENKNVKAQIGNALQSEMESKNREGKWAHFLQNRKIPFGGWSTSKWNEVNKTKYEMRLFSLKVKGNALTNEIQK